MECVICDLSPAETPYNECYSCIEEVMLNQDEFNSPYIQMLADQLDAAILDYIENNEPVIMEDLLLHMAGEQPDYEELDHFLSYIRDTDSLVTRRVQYLQWMNLIPEDSII